MERWVEHFQQLYSRENIPLPEMEELDALPTVDELNKAIDSLACSKAPGSEGIPPGVVKAGKNSSFLDHLHEHLLHCWKREQFCRTCEMLTLSHSTRTKEPGVIATIVVLNRLHLLAERIYQEAQWGFRSQS